MGNVFDSVVNGVSIADATAEDLPLIYVNHAFETMTGYRSAEVIGKNCRFLQRGKTPPGELQAMRKAMKQQLALRTVLKNYTKQGTLFWNELYLSPVFDSEKRLTHYVGIQNDITARVDLKQKIEFLALHDSLTELANRSLMMDRLQQSLARSRRNGQLTAVLFIDLDGFKAINDRLGHDAGDELLRTVGARLRGAARATDCAARMGGDEFVLVVSDLVNSVEAEETVERVMSRLAEPIVLDGEYMVPRASVGLSVFPRDGTSPQELLRAADISMYLDKRARSERASFYNPGEPHSGNVP